jgi:hypothetical protein
VPNNGGWPRTRLEILLEIWPNTPGGHFNHASKRGLAPSRRRTPPGKHVLWRQCLSPFAVQPRCQTGTGSVAPTHSVGQTHPLATVPVPFCGHSPFAARTPLQMTHLPSTDPRFAPHAKRPTPPRPSTAHRNLFARNHIQPLFSHHRNLNSAGAVHNSPAQNTPELASAARPGTPSDASSPHGPHPRDDASKTALSPSGRRG